MKRLLYTPAAPLREPAKTVRLFSYLPARRQPRLLRRGRARSSKLRVGEKVAVSRSEPARRSPSQKMSFVEKLAAVRDSVGAQVL